MKLPSITTYAVLLSLLLVSPSLGYYSQSLGRWTSEDPLGTDPAGKLAENRFLPSSQYRNGVNLYAYVSAMPSRRGDPSGLSSVDWGSYLTGNCTLCEWLRCKWQTTSTYQGTFGILVPLLSTLDDCLYQKIDIYKISGSCAFGQKVCDNKAGVIERRMGGFQRLTVSQIGMDWCPLVLYYAMVPNLSEM
jgi:RHS repeat-associated protein